MMDLQDGLGPLPFDERGRFGEAGQVGITEGIGLAGECLAFGETPAWRR